MSVASVQTDPAAPDQTGLEPDLERRFGALRRLYGDAGYQKIRAAHIAVVGLGGVGSWSVEALARSGVARLTLIDLDHVAESNINRQVQAVGATVGQSKVQALTDRIRDIHPGCDVRGIEEFADAANWPALLGAPADVVIDACDQMHAKAVLSAWALKSNVPLVIVGAAGGKRLPQAIEVGDLACVTHDRMLASLRQRLRKLHGAPATGVMGLTCVFSREAVVMPSQVCEQLDATDGGLNCHGYGSSVAVTATFGMTAAGLALESSARRRSPDRIRDIIEGWPGC